MLDLRVLNAFPLTPKADPLLALAASNDKKTHFHPPFKNYMRGKFFFGLLVGHAFSEIKKLCPWRKKNCNFVNLCYQRNRNF